MWGRMLELGRLSSHDEFTAELSTWVNREPGSVRRAAQLALVGFDPKEFHEAQQPAKIVALGSAMSKFAIVASPNGNIVEPEQLADTPVGVTIYNGSHFTALKMLEGFLRKEEIQVVNLGTMPERLEKVRRGELASCTFNEPWISVARKEGFRIILESHSTRSEAAGDEMDGPTLAANFRAQAKAAAMIHANPGQYAHYMAEETGGRLEPKELQTWRLLYAPPAPYTRERFERTYQWMMSYPDLVAAGASYELVVDNRAWEWAPG